MKNQLKVVSLVFSENLRAFAQRAQVLGVKECRWLENRDKTVTARFVMDESKIKSFVEAADEFGFDPNETLKNFDMYNTSSDDSVEQEDINVAGRDDIQDIKTDGMGEEIETPDEAANNDAVGDAIDAGAVVDPKNREPDEGDPFEGKTGGAFGEADTSLPDLSPKVGVTPGAPLKVDTRPAKINQDISDPNDGVGGEIAKDVKAIISKEGLVAPKSFKVPGYKMVVEGGVDRIRIVPKKAEAKKPDPKKPVAQKR